MIINFQEEKERILLKKSNYICAIGIYVEFAEKIEDALFRYNLYDDIEEEEVKDLVSAMFNAIVAEYMGDQNKLDMERSIFTICNREYVFDIFLIDDESFFFECEQDVEDEEIIMLLYYACQNLKE
ncbi:MAG TPA: hypothetical protein OIM48_06785 [Clostridiaceae bacterium]|jgi:hypothetical protein|nr:hypothetical protein [Clostridium sp.]MEE0127057.1 hypothetical protein [Clostridia bacterium]HJJ12983.1 hypothetical protein [Clostridiaceae bacterium]